MQVQASTVTLLELALVAACAVAVACFFLPLVRAGWQGAGNGASLFDVVAGTGNALSAGDSAFLTLLFVFPSVTIILGLMSDEPLRWVFYLLLGCFLVALAATGQLAGCTGVGVCLYAVSGAVLVACSVAALTLHMLLLRAAACAA